MNHNEDSDPVARMADTAVSEDEQLTQSKAAVAEAFQQLPEHVQAKLRRPHQMTNAKNEKTEGQKPELSDAQLQSLYKSRFPRGTPMMTEDEDRPVRIPNQRLGLSEIDLEDVEVDDRYVRLAGEGLARMYPREGQDQVERAATRVPLPVSPADSPSGLDETFNMNRIKEDKGTEPPNSFVDQEQPQARSADEDRSRAMGPMARAPLSFGEVFVNSSPPASSDNVPSSSAQPSAARLRPIGTTAALPLPFPGNNFGDAQGDHQLSDDDEDDEPASPRTPRQNQGQNTEPRGRLGFPANSDAGSSSSSSSFAHSRPANPNPDSARNVRPSIDSSATAVSRRHSHGSGQPCVGCTVDNLVSRVERLEEAEISRNAERLEGRVMRLEGRETRAEVLRELGEIRRRLLWLKWILRMVVLGCVFLSGGLFALWYLDGIEGMKSLSARL